MPLSNVDYFIVTTLALYEKLDLDLNINVDSFIFIKENLVSAEICKFFFLLIMII